MFGDIMLQGIKNNVGTNLAFEPQDCDRAIVYGRRLEYTRHRAKRLLLLLRHLPFLLDVISSLMLFLFFLIYLFFSYVPVLSL